MKILYAIQGTGNGHLSRARDIIPALRRHAQLDLLVSGTESDVKLPYPVRFVYKGFSFIYNRRGGIHYGKSGWKNFSPRLLREILQVPVKEYDLVINDFEPVSAWACRLRGIPCVAMGHQASFLSEAAPRPEQRDLLGEAVLRYYAPAQDAIGFHFERYADFIHTPVIRQQVRRLNPRDLSHYTVYLPAVKEDHLLPLLKQLPDVHWEVFSRYTRISYRDQNVRVRPVDNDTFIRSLEGCSGILTGAGFETPAEALFLGKKLFCIPIRGQYEQYCNGAALARMGVPVMSRIDETFLDRLHDWVYEQRPLQVDFPDETEALTEQLLTRYQRANQVAVPPIDLRDLRLAVLPEREIPNT
jgi:uncharacterized protein (TIGR00661 family)